MTYQPKTLQTPKTIQEAVSILKEEGSAARVVAGNTTIFELAQQEGLADVETLIDISGLGLNYVKEDANKALHIGSATTVSEIGSSAVLDGRSFYAIKEASLKITPPQIRNMATLGGAICSGVPFYDLPPVLLGLGASMRVASSEGERMIAADDFFVDYFITALGPEDLLVEAQVPDRQNAGSSFVKIGRTSVDFAVVNASALVALDQRGAVKEARVAIGAVAGKPVRHNKAEQNLIGKRPVKQLIDDSASLPLDIDPMPSVHGSGEYKKMVIPVAVREALLAALRRAEDPKAV